MQQYWTEQPLIIFFFFLRWGRKPMFVPLLSQLFVTTLAPALCLPASQLSFLPAFTGYRGSSRCHWFLVLSIKTCEAWVVPSHAVCVWICGCTQPGKEHTHTACYRHTRKGGLDESAHRGAQKRRQGTALFNTIAQSRYV